MSPDRRFPFFLVFGIHLLYFSSNILSDDFCSKVSEIFISGYMVPCLALIYLKLLSFLECPRKQTDGVQIELGHHDSLLINHEEVLLSDLHFF